MRGLANKFSVVKILIFTCLFGIIFIGCNSGGGVAAKDGKSDGDQNGDGGQTATATIKLESGISYDKNFCYTVTLDEAGTFGKSKTTKTCGGSQNNKANSTINTGDTNISWRFHMSFTASMYNGTNNFAYTVTHDPGCPASSWNHIPNEVTANLTCVQGGDFNMQCGLCSGNCSDGIQFWSMNTPAGSTPHATFYISQKAPNHYHVSCTYTW